MDLPDFKKLQKMINFCRKNGIDQVKMGDFEFHITPLGLSKETYYKQKQSEVQTDTPVENQYSDEDMLFWSSAGISMTDESQDSLPKE